MRLLSTISRILVGALFIVSGLIKANDPLGFSYKLHDYFAADVLDLPFLDPWALTLSVLICLVEIILGVAVLVGAKIRLVSWSLLLMIIFFTFLTFYSAYFDKVTDCGCFGDALKFTPWQSFTKDVILFILILFVFVDQKKIKPNSSQEDMIYFSVAAVFITIFSIGVIDWNFPWIFSIALFVIIYLIRAFMKGETREWIAIGVTTVLSGYFTYHVINHLPIRDFRPYAIGKSIPEGMTIPPGEAPPEYGVVYTMTHAQTGEVKEMDSKEYINSGIWEDGNWEITSTSDPILLKEGYEPPIHDFVLISEDGEDLTNTLLTEVRALMVVVYDLTQSSELGLGRINTMAQEAADAGVPVYVLTASFAEEIERAKKITGDLTYLVGDATMLKTTVRANPGVMYLENGVVKGKCHHNDLPSVEMILANAAE